MKILIGGVPFGRNNVGDEAILECVVAILRKTFVDAVLTVSTDDGAETARKLKVNTVELFGFEPPYSHARMVQVIQEHDVFVWAGATGLSDYPEIPLEMLRLAQVAGRKTIVWNVGMNDELNPAKYRVLPGKKRVLLSLLSRLTLGCWDGVALVEKHRVRRAKTAIASTLAAADLVVVRDPESREQVLQSGTRAEVVVGADSALLLSPTPVMGLNLPSEFSQVLSFGGAKVGICVSAQRKIANLDKLVAYCDGVVENDTRRIVFIPMNPITDAGLMDGLRRKMKWSDRAAVLTGRYEPAEILAITSQMDLIISSRLHLIILASIVHIPFIGVSRGSKVDNFLRPYGLKSVGNVEQCDFDRLRLETERLLAGKAAFAAQSREVREVLLERLNQATLRLKEVLS
ncbi:MAG: polysaccharide pyruvyl transferase family protein [bacterium]